MRQTCKRARIIQNHNNCADSIGGRNYRSAVEQGKRRKLHPAGVSGNRIPVMVGGRGTSGGTVSNHFLTASFGNIGWNQPKALPYPTENPWA